MAERSTAGPDGAPRHELTLVTRAGCHLCDDAREALARVAGEVGVPWRELDVDTEPGLADALRADWSDRVPVILLDGAEHGYWRVEEERLRRALTGRGRWWGRR